MNLELIKPDKLLKLSDDKEITNIEVLDSLLTEHKSLVAGRYKKLREAYVGDYPILHQKEKEAYKPDNRVVVNFAKYIVDTFNGFFIGIPIKISSKNKAVDDYINLLDKYNDQDDNNAELSKICSIYGKGYELYFNDENGNIGITYLNPTEGFMVYDDSTLQKPKYFIIYNTVNEEIHGVIYDSTYMYEFNDKGGLHVLEGEIHGFIDVPATEFIENEERMAIFESCYSMINAYNKAISEKANDVDYFADAYLKILGPKLEESDLKNIRDNRIINFEAMDGSGEGITVDFMTKPNADETQENLINRLERLIFQNSMVANINDENFGTSSGIALKYKLLSMSNLAKAKERKFTSGMNRRYKIVFSNAVNKLSDNDWIDVEYKFTQNYPANLLEEAQIASQVSGIVSHETQLSVLSMVEDVKTELERINKEEEQDIANFENHVFNPKHNPDEEGTLDDEE